MKYFLRNGFLIPLSVVGAAWLCLFGFTSASRADVTVADNLDGNTNKISNYTTSGPSGTEFKAQVFTTGAVGGDISFLDLYLSAASLSGSPTMNVYVYDVTGTSISSSPVDSVPDSLTLPRFSVSIYEFPVN